MSSAVIDKLRTERDQARAAALAIAEGENFDPADENFKELEARAAKLDDRIKVLADVLAKQRAADELDGRLVRSEQRSEQRSGPQARQSWGETFVSSDVFAEYRGRGQTSIVDIEDRVQTRALPTGLADLVAAGMTPDKYTEDVTPPAPPTPLINAIANIQVSTNAVEFVSWAKVAGGAAKVAEKGVKPSAEWAPTVTSDTLDNIAVWTQLTRQMIEDKAAVRDMIDGELRRDIVLAEEADAAAVIAAAALPTYNGPAADGLLAAIRHGIATVQTAGYFPNAVLLNPADYAELDISVMGATLNGPAVGRGYWNLTPIPAASQPAGTATVGDFKTAVKRYLRSQVGLYITDSHAETFTSNVFTLLAERRSLTAVVRPQALVEVTATGV